MRRKVIAVLATLGVGAILLDGSGQRSDAQAPLLGSGPPIQMQPVNVSSAMPNQNLSGFFHTPRPPSPLGLGNLFGKVTPPSFQQGAASVPMINPNKNPYQPNLPNRRRPVISPTPPSKSLWNFPFNPFAKRTPTRR